MADLAGDDMVRNYRVNLTRTVWTQHEVFASDAAEAERLAIEYANAGELNEVDGSSWEIDDDTVEVDALTGMEVDG